MQSVKVDAFLSCSFAPQAREVVDFFRAICSGMDIGCINVSTGYAQTPPEKAKQLITDCHGLIAIASKRSTLGVDVFAMPSAVHDEISIAYGLNTRALLFVEEGVQIEGVY